MEVKVEAFTGVTSSHDVTAQTTVVELEAMANVEQNWDGTRTMLIFGRKVLRFGTLGDYGINNGSRIKLCLKIPVFQLFVEQRDRLSTTYFFPSVPVETTVATVKEQLQEVSGIHRSRQRLYGYNRETDGELTDEKTLLDIGISFCNWRLLLFNKLTPDFQIMIGFRASEEYHPLTVHPNDTVLDVRKRCEDVHGFPGEHTCLRYRGFLLTDNIKLCETTIEPNCSIDVTCLPEYYLSRKRLG